MTTFAQTQNRVTTSRTDLWRGAAVTAVAAVLFPRLNSVIYEHRKIWQLDHEAMVLAPLVVAVALAVFALVGTYAWRGPRNRPARVGLVAGIVGIVGIAFFWLSVPIFAGGLAVTLGLEGRRRADEGRRGLATAALVLGVIGVLAGAGIWLANV